MAGLWWSRGILLRALNGQGSQPLSPVVNAGSNFGQAVALLQHDGINGHVGAFEVIRQQISITAGTNTEAQKAAFEAAAFGALAGSTGLEPASYVIVREVSATDWGYSGMTQAARRLKND